MDKCVKTTTLQPDGSLSRRCRGMEIKISIIRLIPPPRKLANRELFVMEIAQDPRTAAENGRGHFLAQLSRTKNMAAQRPPITSIPGSPNPAIPSIAKKSAFALPIRPLLAAPAKKYPTSRPNDML